MRIARVAACAAAVIAAGLIAGVARPAAAPLANAPACPVFPATNVWNKPVDALPVAASSDTMIDAIGRNTGMHPDFGSYAGYGIPYNVVPGGQRQAEGHFHLAARVGPRPLPDPGQAQDRRRQRPPHPDRRPGRCKLYELFARASTRPGWHAGSGAIWDLRSNALRPVGWTSADAAGLPILPGLVRYDEVAAGVDQPRAALHRADTRAATSTRHATTPSDRAARHAADGPARPTQGVVRHLALGPQARVIAEALKHYGMILADNGSPWYVTGSSSSVLGRRRPAPADRFTAPTSRSSTPPDS